MHVRDVREQRRHVVRIRRCKRRAAHDHLVVQHPHRPQIDGVVMATVEDKLRCEIFGCAAQRVRLDTDLRLAVGLHHVGDLLRKSKVDQL